MIRINRSLHFIPLILSTSLFVSSCQTGDSSGAIFDNYLYRLSNSLDVKHTQDQHSAQLMPYPGKSSLSHEIPTLQISILQFLQLSKCDLQRLIGQRNSSLGQLMTGHHSLLYEYEFLQLAKLCQQGTTQSDALYRAIDNAITHKTNYQNKSYWNAIFASDEIRHLFSLGSQTLTHQQLSSSPVKLINALEDIQAWLSNPTTDTEQLQQAYKIIGSSKYIGELRLTMAMATLQLAQADTLLNERLTKKPLCHNERRNRKFDVVDRVFHRFYIGEVQPLLAKLHRQGQILFELIDQLQASLDANQAFMDFWRNVYQSEDSEWRRFDKAIGTHTKNWQQLLRQCGASP